MRSVKSEEWKIMLITLGAHQTVGAKNTHTVRRRGSDPTVSGPPAPLPPPVTPGP